MTVSPAEGPIPVVAPGIADRPESIDFG